MQGVNRWQVHQGDLVEADVNHTLLICTAHAGQPLVAHHRAGRRIENGALADAVTPDQRYAWPPFAAQERAA
jgi:hypothetical protein